MRDWGYTRFDRFAEYPHSNLELVIIDTFILVSIKWLENLLSLPLLLTRELKSQTRASFGLLCSIIYRMA